MPASQPLHVLVVDDDDDVRDLLMTYLSAQGVVVSEARNEAELLDRLRLDEPEVVLLDINLGSEDGFAIARRLRSSPWNGGIVMVTGRGDTIDRVVGLEIGADDYVAKPFDLRELLARVRSVGRRVASARSPAELIESSAAPGRRIRVGEFLLDLPSRTLKRADGTEVLLTTGEFSLLEALAEHPGHVLSRDALLRRTHRRESGPFDRTIDVQIGRLRKKLGDDGSEPRLIKSVRGVGYILVSPR